jgi:hypothetical protein
LSRRCADDIRQIALEQMVDQLPDALPPGSAGDQVGLGPDALERVRDRDGAAAHGEERVVVLRVADGDHVVRRQTTLDQRRGEAARLVDTRGQDHDRALVEDDLQLEAEPANRLQHDVLHRLPAGDDSAANRQRMHAALAQPPHERLGRRRRERGLAASTGP